MPKISELPSYGSAPATSDVIPTVVGGITYKVTYNLLPISAAVQAALDAKLSTAATTYVTQTGTTGAAQLPTGATGTRPTGVTGMVRYNTTLSQFEGYNGSAWSTIGVGATGGTGNYAFFENDQTVTANYTITTGKNAGTFGPVTINTGVAVTVPTGQYWTIVGA